MSSCRIIAAAVLCTLASSVALAGGGDGAVMSPGHNPVLPGFHADPEILFSEATGRYYIYSTTDGTPGWGGHYFKVFSSGNLADWTDEGIVLDLAGPQVAWASGNAWAPAAIECPQPAGQPFAGINADDFYGRNSYEVLARELMRPRDRKGDYAMVGFRVGNTMTENGSVSRGVCENRDGLLASVVERKSIAYGPDHEIQFTDENGRTQTLDPLTPVSMNMWGFTPDYFEFAAREFRSFLDRSLTVPKSEQVIPDVADALIKSGEATIKVLDTDSRWFGVTYAEDRPGVVEKFAALHTTGEYPAKLF